MGSTPRAGVDRLDWEAVALAQLRAKQRVKIMQDGARWSRNFSGSRAQNRVGGDSTRTVGRKNGQNLTHKNGR